MLPVNLYTHLSAQVLVPIGEIIELELTLDFLVPYFPDRSADPS